MKILLTITCLTFSVAFSGCSKFLEIDPPADRLVTHTVFDNDATAISAMTGLYASMMTSFFPTPYNIASYCGLYSDELDYRQSQPLVITIYKYNLNAKDAPTNAIWTNGYNFIYQANSILEGLENSTSINSNVKKQITGEAYFTRAFWYYYLVNLYGDVPLSLNTDYTSNSRLFNSESSRILEQIEADLITARGMLSQSYVASNSLSESPDRIRPNSATASALLCRLYLQQGLWQKAKNEASTIINNSKFILEPIERVFKRDSKEVLWQLELPLATSFYNSYEANYFVLATKPSSVSFFCNSTISNDLLQQFDSTDLRKSNWISTYSDINVNPVMNYNYPSKYMSRSPDIIDEYSTPFRLAEIYLIRAEASANLSQIPEAINDVDKIKARASVRTVLNTNPGISKDLLLEEIAEERRKELFCEWGIRWMDIKRSAMMEDIMANIAAHKSVTWNSNRKLWPIPLNDILNNNNLVQNDGYN
jgi:starch-binding outer membrane protein, SusD/RagB family